MSTETTVVPTAPPAVPIVPGPAVANALLTWPAADRAALAHLLADSVREGFTSLEEAERRDREMIRRRIEDVVSGKAVLLDADEVFRRMDERLAEMRRS